MGTRANLSWRDNHTNSCRTPYSYHHTSKLLDYGKVGDTKEHYWTNSIFHETKGAQARRDAAASIGKNAWVISYTSCTIFGQAKYPQEMARDQNPRLISALRKNLATGSRTFLGVICSDFSDEMLAQLVYRHNFAVQHVTVR
ncbi:MAG: hypothetical protein IJ087_08880, partial [Eggerthellaceae bacterium]|nr:hypothetical protein [Eggerthellaceae bacterium]